MFRLPVKAKPAVTVNTVEALTEPEVASMVVVPTPTVVAKPCEPEVVLTVATLVVEELHVAVLVRFCVLPSL